MLDVSWREDVTSAGGRPVPDRSDATLGGDHGIGVSRRTGVWLATLGCTLAALLFWSAALSFGAQRERDTIAATYARLHAGALAAERYTERILDLSQMLHRMGDRWAVLATLGQDVAAAELGWAIRSTVESSHGVVMAAMVFGPDGALRFTTEPLAPASAVGRDYFDRHTASVQGMHIGAPIILRPSGRGAVPASIRLEDEVGAFRGVVLVTISAPAIASGLATIASAPGEFVSVISEDGVLIARSAGMAELLGRRILSADAALRLVTRPVGETRGPGPVTGREALVAWRAIAGFGLTAVMAADAEAAMQDARAFSRSLTLGATAATALLGMGLLVGATEVRRRSQARAARHDRDALARLEAIHAGMPVGIFAAERHPDGTLRILHEGGDRALLADHGLVSARAPALEAEGFFTTLVQNRRASTEWEFNTPQGGVRIHRVFARILHIDPNGAALIYGIVLDATAEHEALARVEAAKRLSQLGEFALGLAHELKQPLQIITLAADRAQLQAMTLPRAQWAATFDAIIAQAMRASQVIENLRRFARGDAAESPLGPVPCEAVVVTALDLTRGALVAEGIAVTVDLGASPPVVLGRRSALEQVMVNLLLNSRDALAARPPGLPRRVGITVRRDEAQVTIAVADTGGGIPPSIMARIFQPFATTKDPDKGTGLGLSICRGLVIGMGGEIKAANGPEGAVMTIRLPEAT